MKKIGTILMVLLIVLSISLPVSAGDRKNSAIDIDDPIYCKDIAEIVFDLDYDAAQAAEFINSKIDFAGAFLLYSAKDQPNAIFYPLKPVGYVIYDLAEEYVRQYSTDNDHQWYTDPTQIYYYGGAYSYWIKTDDGFYNLMTGQTSRRIPLSVKQRKMLLCAAVPFAVLILIGAGFLIRSRQKKKSIDSNQKA